MTKENSARSAMKYPVDRSPVLFLFSGGIQYLLDVACFAVFVMFGINSISSNFLSRFAAGTFGFLFNGYVTFKFLQGVDWRKKCVSLFRFITILFLQTLMSTLIIELLVALLSKERVVLIKIATEIFMAFISFFVQKHFVYRK